MNKVFVFFLLMSFTLLAVLFYVLYYYKYDLNLESDADSMISKLRSGPLNSLLNGSGINNIPLLNLITTNPEVSRANNCAKGPVFIGNADESSIYGDQDCVRLCMNSEAKVINVQKDETVAYNSTILKRGAYCVLGPRPECNMKTSSAMITINSVVCRPKFPRMIGGPLGATIVACNNDRINDPRNVLWDFKTNSRVDPWLLNGSNVATAITDENEILPEDTYRYRCKYEGEDARGNRYISHPFDRFHSIQNYCASAIYRAHPDVKTIFNEDTRSIVCDCGDPALTRVSHIIPEDKSSLCAAVAMKVENLEKAKQRLIVPYKCFTMFSTLEDVGRYPPCPNDQFTREGSQLASVSMEFTTHNRALIEHPLYKDFEQDDRSGAAVLNKWIP